MLFSQSSWYFTAILMAHCVRFSPSGMVGLGAAARGTGRSLRSSYVRSFRDALNGTQPSQRKVSLWWRKRGGCGLLFGVPPRPCVTGCSYGTHGGPRSRLTGSGRWIALARGHARAAPRAGRWRFPRSPVAKTRPRDLRDPALESRRAPPTGRRAVVARVGEAPSAAPCLLSLPQHALPRDRPLRQ